MVKLLFIFLPVILYGCTSCSWVMKWQTEYPDNELEESAEELIEKYTNKEIDLSPVTGEEKQSIDIFDF